MSVHKFVCGSFLLTSPARSFAFKMGAWDSKLPGYIPSLPLFAPITLYSRFPRPQLSTSALLRKENGERKWRVWDTEGDIARLKNGRWGILQLSKQSQIRHLDAPFLHQFLLL